MTKQTLLPNPMTIEAITAFMDFTLGFPHNFVEEAWEDHPHLIPHIRSKINSAKDVAPIALIPWLWTTLSTGNREILINYICRYWNK